MISMELYSITEIVHIWISAIGTAYVLGFFFAVLSSSIEGD